MSAETITGGRGISENVSEKKKRGRPRLLDVRWEAEMRRAGRQYFSTRTIQNEDYEARAYTVLGLSSKNLPDSPYRWLNDPSKIKYGSSQRPAYRKTILAELGRIADDETLQAVALEICRTQPRTQDAIRFIRRLRLGRGPQAEQPSLEDAIWRAVEDYRSKHPTLTDEMILESVSAVEEKLRDIVLEREFRAALG